MRSMLSLVRIIGAVMLLTLAGGAMLSVLPLAPTQALAGPKPP